MHHAAVDCIVGVSIATVWARHSAGFHEAQRASNAQIVQAGRHADKMRRDSLCAHGAFHDAERICIAR